MFKMGREKRGPLALEAWARQLTDGYPHVAVKNMTTSWRNGLAFCALIHRFRPDLIDYDKLDPSDIMGNCSLAFETAESKLGIPALLDPEDMAAHEVPDRLSVLTYVAQFYSLFKNAEKKSTVPTHRQKDDVDLKTRSSDKSTTPSSEKIASPIGFSTANNSSSTPAPGSPSLSSVSATKRRFELPDDTQTAKRSALLAPPPCSKCQNPVYISERTVFNKKLYHRKCFTCHGCDSMLNPHTADISADGTHFFCLAKDCQLQLMKLNRGGGGKGSNGDNGNSFPSSSTLTADSSIVVRNSPSELKTLKNTTDNNGHGIEQSGDNISLSDNHDHGVESKENVPLRDKTRIGDNGEDVTLAKVGRVSRLTARFECVQEDKNQNALPHIPPNHSTQEKIDDRNNHVHDDKLSGDYNVSSRPPDSYVDHPSGISYNDKNVDDNNGQRTGDTRSFFKIRDDKDNTTSSISVSNNCDDNNMIPEQIIHSDKNEVEANVKSNIVKTHQADDKEHVSTSELNNARSHWLKGQIEETQPIKEKEEIIKILNEDLPEKVVFNSPLEEEMSIPQEVISEDIVNPKVSDSISVNFKLDVENEEEKEAMDVDENIGDSGIGEVSTGPTDNAFIAISKTETEQIDTHQITPRPCLSELKEESDNDPIEQDNITEPQISNETVCANSSHEEEKTSTTDSSSVINPSCYPSEKEDTSAEEVKPECIDKQEETKLTLYNQEKNLSTEINQNPFAQDDEEDIKVDKIEGVLELDPLETKVADLGQPISVESNDATSKHVEPPEIMPPVPPSPVADIDKSLTSTEQLTPTPRKKKRAPQPSPQLLQSVSTPAQEPVRPMPSPRTRSKMRNSNSNLVPQFSSTSLSLKQEEYPEELNPFGDDDEVLEVPQLPPTPKPRPKSITPALSVNPFEDDDEESTLSIPEASSCETSFNLSKSMEANNTSSISESSAPQPAPRNITPKPYNPFEDEEEDDDIGTFEDDKPIGLFARGSHDDTSSISSKTSDLSNTSGIAGGFSSHHKSFNASDIGSLSGSTKGRPRKSRRAPLPPGMMGGTSVTTTLHVDPMQNSTEPQSTSSPIISAPPSPKKVIPVSPKIKLKPKEVTKVQYRKKRRAPPPRRRVEPLPEEQIKTELNDLEIKQKELERQGISLEDKIRQLMSEDEQSEEKLESNNSSGDQMDDMIIQLWSIVNEKNDILRRQTELEYLRRSHRLEEMQADLEFQLRVLMDTPEDQRAEDHVETEQMLLDELLNRINERDEVVNWLDYYRQMDREEEMQVSKSIREFKTHHHSGIAEMVSKLKSKKDKKKEEKKSKAKESSSTTNGIFSKSLKTKEEDGDSSSSSKGKKKDKDKHSGLGIFGTLRKKSSKNKQTKMDEDKHVNEIVVDK